MSRGAKLKPVKTMRMKEFSPDDVSILALIARNPNLPQREFVDLLGRLSQEAQPVAHTIVALERARAGDIVTPRSGWIRQAAEALLSWAKSNKSEQRRAQFRAATTGE